MSRDELARMDLSTGFLYHRKTRALQAAHPTAWPAYYMAYLAVLAESWSKGRRVPLSEAWTVAIPCPMDEALTALRAVELLDATGRMRTSAFKEWVEPALLRIGRRSEAGRVGARAKWDKAKAAKSERENGRSGNAIALPVPPSQSDSDAPSQPAKPAKPASQNAPARPGSDTGPDEPDALDAWFRLTGSTPSPKVLPWLEELCRSHGDAAVEQALAAEVSIDMDRKTLLSRTQARLEAAERHAAKRRQDADRAAAAAERARIEAMPEDQRAANLERLGDMMRNAGLLPAPAPVKP